MQMDARKEDDSRTKMYARPFQFVLYIVGVVCVGCRPDRSGQAQTRPLPVKISLVQTALTPERFLGLDHGERRIGVALSDAMGLTAQPLLTLHRTQLRADMRSLARLARRHQVTEIVVGLPLHLSGDASPRSQAAREFATQLQAATHIPVHLWDERMSTAEAHRHLDAAGRAAGAGRRDVIDQVAAVLILQSYLDARQNARPAPNAPGGVESV